eukprot:366510-Chlamydomonas_euryale.AAC.27
MCSKAEVANLLESAGFSRANPYYIVQQGKIMHMSHMKDTERLSLLKEIGGTGVYEERRKESLKVMGDTETRRAQIEDMMTVIEEKLKDLDGERKELAEYMVVDKQRRWVHSIGHTSLQLGSGSLGSGCICDCTEQA